MKRLPTTIGIAALFIYLTVTGGMSASSSPTRNEGLSNKIALATNHLAIDIYKSLPQLQNAFFSPMSIATAFGMVYHGARGTTAQEMRTVLGYDRADLPENQVHKAFKEMLRNLLTQPKNYTLDIANKALTTASIPTLEAYRNDLVEYYQAEMEEVDFANNGNNIMNSVNRWVNQKTRGKIPSILSEPPDPLTALLLLNAVYFKGTWKSKFNENSTKLNPFFNSGSTSKDVQMMHMEANVPYTNSEELNSQVLELPYIGEDLGMVFVLPNDRNGMEDLESRLSLENLQKAISRLRMTRGINIRVPRFKFEEKYDLKSVMKSIGLRQVFSDHSDLSGISTAYPLVVSDAIHKAVVEVNEEGSEAAAVTSVTLVIRSRWPFRQEINFDADHPFIFLIREKSTGLILFMGRVNDL